MLNISAKKKLNFSDESANHVPRGLLLETQDIQSPLPSKSAPQLLSQTHSHQYQQQIFDTPSKFGKKSKSDLDLSENGTKICRRGSLDAREPNAFPIQKQFRTSSCLDGVVHPEKDIYEHASTSPSDRKAVLPSFFNSDATLRRITSDTVCFFFFFLFSFFFFFFFFLSYSLPLPSSFHPSFHPSFHLICHFLLPVSFPLFSSLTPSLK